MGGFALPLAIGGISTLLSGLFGRGKPGSSEGADLLKQIQDYIGQYTSLGQQYMYPGGDLIRQFLGGEGLFANPELGYNGILNLMGELGGFRNKLGTLWNDFSLPPEVSSMLTSLQTSIDRSTDIANNFGVTPSSAGTRDILTNLLQNNPDNDALRAFAAKMFSGGGMNPDLINMQNAGMGILGNTWTDALTELSNKGRTLINAEGRTPESDAAMNSFLGMLAGGGQTDQTKAMFGAGKDLFGTGGFTPQMTALMGPLMAQINANGMTPEAKQLFASIMPIINAGGAGGALMPFNQVVSFARDEAATANQQAQAAAVRNALRRQGSAAASGITEQAIAEYADEAARNEATAVRGAATDQQKLQLQQLLGALGAGSDITKNASGLLGQLFGTGADITRSAATNLGTAGGLQEAAAKIAAGNYGTAAGGVNDLLRNILARFTAGGEMITGADKAAMGRASTGADIIRQVQALAQGNLGLGVNALGQVNTFGADIARNLTSLAGVDAQTLMQAIAALTSATGQGADIFNTQQKTYLAGKDLEFNNFLKSLGMSAGLNTDFTKQFLDATGQLTDIGRTYMQMLPSLFGAYGNIGSSFLRGQQQPSMFQQLMQGLLGGTMGGLSDIFSKLPFFGGGGGGTSRTELGWPWAGASGMVGWPSSGNMETTNP